MANSYFSDLSRRHAGSKAGAAAALQHVEGAPSSWLARVNSNLHQVSKFLSFTCFGRSESAQLCAYPPTWLAGTVHVHAHVRTF
jgi:hypothetical protein